MTESSTDLPELERAIQDVYRGPLEEFVARRGALVKQLRASKRRDDAEKVKALRKPSRAAWALDSAVHDDSGPIDRLAAALTAAQEAQSRGGGDLRAALDNVRTTSRAFAEAAARAATAAGHQIEAASLVTAVSAVIGDATAFEALRAGMLADLPEGGGLDFLTAVAPAVRTSPAIAESPEPRKKKHSDEEEAARAEVERAGAALSAARERSKAAQRVLREAEEKLATAEQELQRARDEVADRRADLERARSDAKAAVAQEHEAERAAGKFRLRIES
jgi:hypothetical protein